MDKVSIGAPCRNRGWILTEYLAALKAIDYSNKDYLFLVNDSQDETAQLLNEFGVLVIEMNNFFSDTPGHRRGEYNIDSYAHLADIRNMFIDMFLTTDADYLFSVDSDVIVPPDILNVLLSLADQQTIVGAAISNIAGVELDGHIPGNFMVEQNGLIIHPAEYPLQGVMPVDLIGACYLIPRAVLEAGVRYGAHPQGEDVFFCQQAKEKGFKMLVSFDVRPEHRMVEPCSQ